MNWILEHLQLVLAIAGAFAFWLKQRSESKAEKDKPVRPAQPATMAEADDAERARKIREEIMRKIAERRGEAVPPKVAARPEEPKKFRVPTLGRPHAPLDTFGGPSRPVIVQRAEPAKAEPPVLVARGESQEAILGRQERLAEQMRELEEKKAATLRRAAVQAEVKREADGVWHRAASNVREELRDPRALRHAIILREVLGTPVGLR